MTEIDDTEAAVRRALQEGYDRLRGYIRKQIGDPAHADDVMNAFCERALAGAAAVAEGAAVKSWLSRVLASVIADHYRAMRRKAKREFEFDDAKELDLATLDPALADVVCGCLESLVDVLSPGDAALVRAIDIEGESRAIVADQLGLTPNALNVRLHRARERLKALVLRLCAPCMEHGFENCACPPKH